MDSLIHAALEPSEEDTGPISTDNDCQHHYTYPTSSQMKQQNTWQDNSIQFPRLIDEIQASGVFGLLLSDGSRVIDSIAISMDLDVSHVFELIDRAQHEWDTIKSRTFAPATPEA